MPSGMYFIYGIELFIQLVSCNAMFICANIQMALTLNKLKAVKIWECIMGV